MVCMTGGSQLSLLPKESGNFNRKIKNANKKIDRFGGNKYRGLPFLPVRKSNFILKFLQYLFLFVCYKLHLIYDQVNSKVSLMFM